MQVYVPAKTHARSSTPTYIHACEVTQINMRCTVSQYIANVYRGTLIYTFRALFAYAFAWKTFQARHFCEFLGVK